VKQLRLTDDTYYEQFEAPAYELCHIIWNIYVIDKSFAALPNFKDIIEENNVKYILAILPDKETYSENVKVDLDHDIMIYKDHSLNSFDTEQFDKHIKKIEELRKERNNTFVFCNNGYQRSIPFLCYYLVKYRSDEVPTIDRAIDIILPQIDKGLYATKRNEYIEKIKMLFYSKHIMLYNTEQKAFQNYKGFDCNAST
jgi:hypothetical protein